MNPPGDLILRLARLGAWLESWREVNATLPDEGAVQLALTRYGVADLDPTGPGVVPRPEVAANRWALIDPDDCHP